MSIIGHFRPSRSGGWEGQVRTLCLNVSLRFAPNDDRTHPNAPAFRVMVGHSHVGDAWERPRQTDPPRPMFRVLLDDPLLPAVIDAALFPDEAGERAILVWQRQTPQRRREESAAPEREGAIPDQEPVSGQSGPISGDAASALA